MKRAALYARLSTAEQNCAAQLDALRAYCERRALEPREFVDAGVSGAKDRRPALDAMLHAVRRREVDLVAVVKLDRLARSVRHLTTLAAELEALGVDLVVVDQGVDTSTPAGKLLFHVLASIAEFERALIIERTRAGLAAARRRGTHCGRPRTATTSELAARAQRMRGAGQGTGYIAVVLGVSERSVRRMLAAAASGR
jgi:DNA invertase Pin-like site-specific DNA recombinase